MYKKLGIVAIALLIIAGIISLVIRRSPEKTSRFGEYQGYSEEVYSGTARFSDYLTLASGTRLAYDLILPTVDGVATDEALPVLFKYTPYLRAFTIFDDQGKDIISPLYNLTLKEKLMLRVRYWVYDRGHLMDALFQTQWLEKMVQHGYAVVVVEKPGTGASFGVMNPSFEQGALETDEILNWIADHPWSDGNIGMYGDSWEAQIQIAAASTGNPHLKAIMPASTSLDNYTSVVFPGGVYNQVFGDFFSWANSFFESDVLTPVDGDLNGDLLAQARAERVGSTVGEKSATLFQNYPFRDSRGDSGSALWGDAFALYPFIDRINQAVVAVYLTNGWFDLFSRDMFLLYANLEVPKRLSVRPLDHSQIQEKAFDLDYGAEAHRWFDYWLKGIDNGIMDEPPIHYYVMGEGDQGWQTSEQWPLSNTQNIPFYFAEGRSGSVESVNDGLLNSSVLSEKDGVDEYTVDYSTNSGPCPRWCGINWEREYEDMRPNDEKSLTYTTPVLDADLEITGHPVAHLWLSTSAPDLDVFVYLEDVAKDGSSTYITEGVLRASHRQSAEAPYDTFGLPFNNHFESELLPLESGEPFLLDFDLLPTSYRFAAGHRLRVTVAFADQGVFETPNLDPIPFLNLLRSSPYPSRIELPVIAISG